MIEKICNFIMKKIRNNMPDIDDERAEVISYGIQIIIGEIPKMFLILGFSFLLGVGWYTLLALVVLIPYRATSGGFHLKTHLGCFLGTALYYYGTVFISKFLVLDSVQKYILVGLAFVFGIIMISLYAPADTENVPIISKKERKTKKILSYITLTITLGVSLFITNPIISNIFVIGTIIQTMMITRIAYKLTNNKYGHEVYRSETQPIN